MFLKHDFMIIQISIKNVFILLMKGIMDAASLKRHTVILLDWEAAEACREQ